MVERPHINRGSATELEWSPSLASPSAGRYAEIAEQKPQPAGRNGCPCLDDVSAGQVSYAGRRDLDIQARERNFL